MARATLLVELFVEELPPKALKRLGEAFAGSLADGLRAVGLVDAGAEVTPFASPRRLGALIAAVRDRAPDQAVTHKLMPVSVGLDGAGQPTPALLKKLAALGAGPDAAAHLERRLDGKAEALFHATQVRGATLAEGLQKALDAALAGLPIPKVMRYQLDDGWTSVDFVRPAHALVALHGADVVPVRVLGLEAGRATHGHRFEARRDPVVLESADDYEQRLVDDGAVIAGFAARRAETAAQLQRAAKREGLAPVDDDALLDEVTALVERPNVLTCRFEPEFLAVPPEVLTLTMKANQKYFPLFDRDGALTNRFLVVSNIRPADPSRVVEGNERVVRPRLADAKFFFDQDRKKTLASRVARLDKVVYHGRLGTQGARVARLRAIARWVAERIGADVAQAERAAELAKADLLTDMVGEFPELQGVMGGYYARHDGEPDDVADAIAGQYVNRRRSERDDGSAGLDGSDRRDGCDRDGSAVAAVNRVAEALRIADRVETLVGIWGIGLKPTGDKDPYALRRHALTLIHSFASLATADRDAGARLSLRELLRFARSTFDSIELAPETVDEVEDFVYERCANQLAAGFDVRAVDAVVAQRPPLQQVGMRLEAVRAFQRLDEASALAAANKRVGNILKKSDAAPAARVDVALLTEPAEIALHAALGAVAPVATARFEAGDYAASLQSLAALRAPVDAFFDRVMVNADDPALRTNRLALLGGLHAAMNRVADLSKLAL